MDCTMAIIPTDIWQEIFALACTDSGLTGRSLSLVSKYFHDISMSFKYQSVAITRWRQLFAFAQIISELPDSQKRIKYLFIHCPYPFMDVEDDPSPENKQWWMDSFGKNPVRYGRRMVLVAARDIDDSDDEDCWFIEEDSESESQTGRSLNSDEKQEILKSANSLQAGKCSPHPGLLLLSCEGKTQQEDVQAVFDKATQALHTILNETSSTLNILTLYWASSKPLLVHQIIPPLPFLDELHLFRCSAVRERREPDNSLITSPLPRLRLLYMSGDEYYQNIPCFIPNIAPNLTHLRCTYEREDILYKINAMPRNPATDSMEAPKEEQICSLKCALPVMEYPGELPEAWQSLWSSRVAGRPELWSIVLGGIFM